MVPSVYFPAASDLCHGDPLLMPRPRRNEGVTLPGHRGIPIYNAGRIPDAARPIVRRSEPQKRPVASKKRLPRGPQLPQNLLAVASRRVRLAPRRGIVNRRTVPARSRPRINHRSNDL